MVSHVTNFASPLSRPEPHGADDLTVWDCAAEVPAVQWDLLVGAGDLYLSHRWLGLAERFAGSPMRYLRLCRNGQPAAALATVLATAKTPWVSGRLDALLAERPADEVSSVSALLKRLAGGSSALMPTLLCGGRQTGRSRILCAAVSGAAQRADVEVLVCEAEHVATQMGAASISFPYLDVQEVILQEALVKRGYLSFATGLYHQLAVDSRGISSYLNGLPRKQRRLAEREQIRQAGIELSIEQLTPAVIPRLAELGVQLVAKYGSKANPESAAAQLRTISETLGPDASAVIARAAGEICGFAQLLRHGNHWYVRQVGFDHEFQGRLPLYFEVFFYYPMERAVEFGITTIHYGLGSDQAKRSRGCIGTDQRCFFLPLGGS